ncbi:lipopolysaccharide biosynthesis protein [Desulfocicer vacuolatum]|nr:oligosaccharide flippase family protein [Desulfocicer vacuolatum]
MKSLGKHFMVYGVGRILGKLAAFFLIPIYTSYLTTEAYGTLELLELTTYVVGMFVAAGIGQAVMRFYYETNISFQRRQIVSTSLISVWIISICATVILILNASHFSMMIFQGVENTTLFKLIFISMMISIVNEIPLSFVRAQQKSFLFTMLSLLQLIIALGLNIFFLVILGWGVQGIILSGILSQGGIGCFVLIYTLKYCGIHFSWDWFKKMLLYGLPFIPAGLGYFVLNFTDRFFLQRFVSLSDVGIYSLGYKFGMILSPMITEPFLSIFQPKMFELADGEGAQAFVSSVMTYLVFLEVFAGLGIAVLIQDVIHIMSDRAFWSAGGVVPLILLSYVFVAGNAVLQVGILIRKKTKWIGYMVAGAAAMNVILNYFLIPWYGYWGAAYATVISTFFLLIICYFLSNRIFPVSYEWKRLIKIILLATAIYWTAGQIHLGCSYLSMGVKIVLVMMFPFLLYLCRFYNHAETNKLREVLLRFHGRIPGWR